MQSWSRFLAIPVAFQSQDAELEAVSWRPGWHSRARMQSWRPFHGDPGGIPEPGCRDGVRSAAHRRIRRIGEAAGIPERSVARACLHEPMAGARARRAALRVLRRTTRYLSRKMSRPAEFLPTRSSQLSRHRPKGSLVRRPFRCQCPILCRVRHISWTREPILSPSGTSHAATISFSPRPAQLKRPSMRRTDRRTPWTHRDLRRMRVCAWRWSCSGRLSRESAAAISLTYDSSSRVTQRC